MAASSVSFPFCTWILAAYMSAGFGNDPPTKMTMFRSSKLRNLHTRRKKLQSECNSSYFSTDLISSLCVLSIQNVMSSCLAFEPCHEYCTSKGLSSPLKTSSRRKKVKTMAMAVALEPIEKAVKRKERPITKDRRVVVTGMGVETPVGHDHDEFYNNLLHGVSGISEIEGFDCSHFPTKIAGEIKSFSAHEWVSPKLSRRADKFMLYLITAGKKALLDAGITQELSRELNKARCGVIIGSAMGGMKIFADAIDALRISYKKMNPFCVPFATSNMGSAILAMELGWMGPNYSISSACATSNICILNAANHIIRGETDMMLCGGSDAAIIPVGLGGYAACKALSRRNEDPTKASRPWDTDRDGFVIGEGAGVLLLEELEHAKRRGANIYAEFLGGSITCDAHHMIQLHPDGTGSVLSMEKALLKSGVAREDVNYINAHATSGPGDLGEYKAIVRCFGENPQLRINSSKSMIGHLLGASGAVDAVATIKAIQTGWVHPNINLENPDIGVDMNLLVGARKERLDVKVALSNSFGFGGHNSSILFKRYEYE